MDAIYLGDSGENISYSELSYLMQQLNCDIHPSEIHGLMCGLVSVLNIDNAMNHIQDYLHEHSRYELLEPETQQLSNFLINIYGQLSAYDFSLTLLLPDDQEPLEERINALALWCQGFLTGLSLVQRTINEIDERHQHIAKVIQEITLDFSRIADVQSQYVSDTSDDPLNYEEDEVSYTELVEYTRIAVLTLFTELSPLFLTPSQTYH